MKEIIGILSTCAATISCNSNDTAHAGTQDTTNVTVDAPKAVVADSSTIAPKAMEADSSARMNDSTGVKKDSAH